MRGRSGALVWMLWGCLGCGAPTAAAPLEPIAVAVGPAGSATANDEIPEEEALTWEDVRRRLVDAAPYMCRILSDGRVGCWDYPESGAHVLPANEPFVSVAARLNRPSVRTRDGRSITWDFDTREPVVQYHDILMMAAGAESIVVLQRDGTVGYTSSTEGPADTVEGLEDVVFVAGKGMAYGAITASGELFVFRSGRMLGEELDFPPIQIPLSGPASFIALESRRGCAVVNGEEPRPAPGAVVCWETEAGTMKTIAVPPVWRLAISTGHACGMTRGGDVYCWGDNDAGQLGQGHAEPIATPAKVPLTIRARDITALGFGQGEGMCAVDERKTYCWGFGHGSTPVLQPAPITLAN